MIAGGRVFLVIPLENLDRMARGDRDNQKRGQGLGKRIKRNTEQVEMPLNDTDLPE